MTLFHLTPTTSASARRPRRWHRALGAVAVEMTVCAATLAAIAVGAMLLR